MLIHGDADVFVPQEQVLALGQVLIARKSPLDDHFIVDDAQHVLALAANPQAYRERLSIFLARL